MSGSQAKDSYTVDLPLNELENELSSRQFFRANRAALVNLNRIRETQPYFRSIYVLLTADTANTQLQLNERQARQLPSRVPGLKGQSIKARFVAMDDNHP